MSDRCSKQILRLLTSQMSQVQEKSEDTILPLILTANEVTSDPALFRRLVLIPFDSNNKNSFSEEDDSFLETLIFLARQEEALGKLMQAQEKNRRLTDGFKEKIGYKMHYYDDGVYYVPLKSPPREENFPIPRFSQTLVYEKLVVEQFPSLYDRWRVNRTNYFLAAANIDKLYDCILFLRDEYNGEITFVDQEFIFFFLLATSIDWTNPEYNIKKRKIEKSKDERSIYTAINAGNMRKTNMLVRNYIRSYPESTREIIGSIELITSLLTVEL